MEWSTLTLICMQFPSELYEGTQLPSVLVPSAGERLGGLSGNRYEIQALLGSGGMGRVYRALDRELQRTVALKFLLPHLARPRAEQLSLLREEARLIARLDHENIVRLHDVAEWETQAWEDGGFHRVRVPFLVMEHLEGRSLRAALRLGGLDLQRKLELMTDVAAGLMHAHERHLIHSDLKPGNVFVLDGGSAKLLDFGLAHLMAGGSEAWLAGAGTPAYMSPEQWQRRPPDPRDDIWAAGILLFELLTDQHPFPELSGEALRARITSTEPVPSVREHRQDLPEELARLVAAALARNPEERIPNGAELLKRLWEVREHLGLRRRNPLAGVAERRQVTFLSCRLAVTADAGEPDSEDAGELETAFHRGCSTLLQQHGALVMACVGDQVLACFGYPSAREDASAEALRAGLHLLEAIPRELAGERAGGVVLRVGIHTDLVAVDDTTSGFHGAPSIQGKAPLIANWLAAEAAPHSVLVSDRTHVLVRGRFETRPAGQRTFVGLSGSSTLDTYQLLRELSGVSRFDRVLVLGELTPLVGRERELAQLTATWSEAVRGRGSCILLRGEAGVGKSRLVQELHDRAAPEACPCVSCQCWPQFKGTAFYPLTAWLQHFLGLSPEDPPERKLHLLEEPLGPMGLTSEHAHALASLLSVPLPKGAPFLQLTPERQRERSMAALVALLRGMARQHPLGFVLEDVHWADESTLQFLGLLLEHLEDTRLCVLLTARPEFRHGWARHPRFQELEIAPLSAESTAAMIQQVARGKALPEELGGQLVARTDGIPLFIEEMTRLALQRGDPGRPSVGAAQAPIPTTLQELLVARLDQLPPRAKTLAQLASTLGRELSYEMLRAISLSSEKELLEQLEQLEQAGLLFRHGEPPYAVMYTFKHALIQAAAYQSLLRRTQKRYHARITQKLSEQFPELAEEQPELLAHHSSLAGLSEQAAAQWRSAGERARAKSALSEATGHFTRAIEQLALLPPSRERDQQEFALQVELAETLIATTGFTSKRVLDAYTRAYNLCEPSGTIPMPVLWGLTTVAVLRGDKKDIDRLVPHLERLIETSEDPLVLIAAHCELATVSFRQGQLVSCRQHGGKAKVLARQHGLLHPTALRTGHYPGYVTESLLYSLLYLAYSEVLLGNADQGRREYEEVLALAEATHSPYDIARVLMFGTVIVDETSEPAAVRAVAGRAISLAREHKFPTILAMCDCIDGCAAVSLGEPHAGLAQIHEGLALIRSMSAMALYPRTLEFFARACLITGRTAEGLAATSEALEMTETRLTPHAIPELRRLEGELLLRQGNAASARIALRKALETARKSGAKLHELRAAVSLARLMRRDGEVREARALVAEIYGRFTEGFDVADCKAARRFLAELS